MYEDKKIFAIIPARGGSKGVKRKNIKLLDGKPLIQYSIDEGKKSKYIDDVYVSTEDEEIAKISKDLGAKVPYLRPESLALDTSSTSEVILDFIEKIEKNLSYDLVVLLQPTTPLRTVQDIDNAIEKFCQKNYTSLITVAPMPHPIQYVRKIDDKGFLQKYVDYDNKKSRRQDFEKLYILNGAIYIMTVENYKIYKSFDIKDTGYYLMSSENSADIDNPIDFDIAEAIIKSRKSPRE